MVVPLRIDLDFPRSLVRIFVAKAFMIVSKFESAHGGSPMTMDANLLEAFTANVDWVYAGLVRLAESDPYSNPQKGMSGKLLYADELLGAGSVLVIAAKIAGASSLTATANRAAQRQAIRDGVVNFLLPSVAEALWILRKEIRMRNTVAVCVTQPPHVVEQQMAALGVIPDLLPPGALMSTFSFEDVLGNRARKIDPVSATEGQTILTWSVDRAPARWLPKLDDVALGCLDSYRSPHGCDGLDTWSARRWLSQAPRYLGRLARGIRLLRCPTEVARAFLSRVSEMTTTGMMDVAVEINLCSRGDLESHRIA